MAAETVSRGRTASREETKQTKLKQEDTKIGKEILQSSQCCPKPFPILHTFSPFEIILTLQCSNTVHEKKNRIIGKTTNEKNGEN